MIALLADENFDNRVLRGLTRRNPKVDIVRVQDVGLSGVADPEILAWAAAKERMLVTHDVSTMTKYATQRVKAGESMRGVIECPRAVPIAVAIEHLLLIAECSQEGEWRDQILYLPL